MVFESRCLKIQQKFRPIVVDFLKPNGIYSISYLLICLDSQNRFIALRGAALYIHNREAINRAKKVITTAQLLQNCPIFVLMEIKIFIFSNKVRPPFTIAAGVALSTLVSYFFLSSMNLFVG